MDTKAKLFTVVFEGDMSTVAGLFDTETPYGKIVLICAGDKIGEASKLREALADANETNPWAFAYVDDFS